MAEKNIRIERGIVFDEEKHQYSVDGKVLSGITRVVGKRTGKVFSPKMQEIKHLSTYSARGKRIHALAEEYFRFGTHVQASKDAEYIVKVIDEKYPSNSFLRIPEMLVSDRKDFATAIDLVCVSSSGEAHIFDYKSGAFNREYCAWQLGICKYLLELELPYRVTKCYVLATGEEYTYEITPKSEALVIARLNAEREKISHLTGDHNG